MNAQITDQIASGALMTQPIIFALMFNVLLFSLLLGAQVLVRSTTHGVRFALSNLDKSVQMSKLENRLKRVKSNQLEFLVLLMPVAIIAAVSGSSMQHACWTALAFIAGRPLYIFFALAGIRVLRSMSWLTGFLVWLYMFLQLGRVA